jgi:hypothetical protein
VPKFPMVVTLCGSTKFKDTFIDQNKKLTKEGIVVLSVGWFSHAEDEKPTEDEKIILDVLHLRKIDISVAILVLNINQYIGESTKREIAYARSTGKSVWYLEKPYAKEVIQDEDSRYWMIKNA